MAARSHGMDLTAMPQSFVGGLLFLKPLVLGSAFRGSGLSARRRFTRALKSSGVTACALPVVSSRAISASASWPKAQDCAEGCSLYGSSWSGR